MSRRRTAAPHTSQLKFTGRDDEFYDIKAGDQINVLVRNDNPDQIIKALDPLGPRLAGWPGANVSPK